jgi:hypothetical protein
VTYGEATCSHDGGVGIGAGHRCTCNMPKGHSLDSERPHGCSCGAMWADKPATFKTGENWILRANNS